MYVHKHEWVLAHVDGASLLHAMCAHSARTGCVRTHPNHLQ